MIFFILNFILERLDRSEKDNATLKMENDRLKEKLLAIQILCSDEPNK